MTMLFLIAAQNRGTLHTVVGLLAILSVTDG